MLARAHAGVGGAEKETLGRAYVRMCERYHAPASRGGRADVSKPTKMPVGCARSPCREGRQLLPAPLLLPAGSSSRSLLFTRTSRVFFRVKRTAHRNPTRNLCTESERAHGASATRSAKASNAQAQPPHASLVSDPPRDRSHRLDRRAARARWASRHPACTRTASAALARRHRLR